MYVYICIDTGTFSIKGPSGQMARFTRGSSQASSVFNTNAGDVPGFVPPKLPERMASQIAATAAVMTRDRPAWCSGSGGMWLLMMVFQYLCVIIYRYVI